MGGQSRKGLTRSFLSRKRLMMGCEQQLTQTEELQKLCISLGIAYERKFIVKRLRERYEEVKNHPRLKGSAGETALALLQKLANVLENESENPDNVALKIVLASRPKSCKTKEN